MGKEKKKATPLRIVLRAVLCVVLCIVIVAIGYVAYVMIDYSRIADNVPGEIVNTTKRERQVAEGHEDEYTVLTQNIGFGAYTADFTFFMDGGKESRGRSKESVIDCVKQAGQKVSGYNPDFALFQEVDFDSTRSYHTDQREILKEYFGGYSTAFAVNYHSAYLFYPFNSPHGASYSGIMTFSGYPIENCNRRSLPISTSFSKFLDLDRCYTISKIPVENGKTLVLFNVHLSAYGGSDAIRTAQMSMLFADMKAEYDQGNYCVCGGDFNHDFTGTSTMDLNGGSENASFGWAQPFPAELLSGYNGVSRAIAYDEGKVLPTCRNCDIPYVEGNFTIIVDGFLVSDNVEVLALENLQTRFVYSDHNPVIMKFKLN